MAAKPPPVPPEQQGPHGAKVDQGKEAETRNERERNLDQQGRQGNIKQNINNQGQQQDR